MTDHSKAAEPPAPTAEPVQFDDDVTREQLWGLAQSYKWLVDSYRKSLHDADE